MTLENFLGEYSKAPEEFKESYAGNTIEIYVPRTSRSAREIRNTVIREQFKGGLTADEIARQLELSIRHVKRIVDK